MTILVAFLLQISLIFACGLQFSQKTLLYIFFCWVALCFRVLNKKGTFPSGIFLSNASD